MVPDLLRIPGRRGPHDQPGPAADPALRLRREPAPERERDLPLLLEQVRHEPRRVYLWWHLGTVHAGLGEMDQAWAAFEHGLQIVR